MVETLTYSSSSSLVLMQAILQCNLLILESKQMDSILSEKEIIKSMVKSRLREKQILKEAWAALTQ